MKIKKAIILGAGFGKRMYPITKKIPKPLVKIKNKTILENTINFLISLGVKHIIINTHYLHNQISSFVKNKKFSCKIDLVFEKKENIKYWWRNLKRFKKNLKNKSSLY